MKQNGIFYILVISNKQSLIFQILRIVGHLGEKCITIPLGFEIQSYLKNETSKIKLPSIMHQSIPSVNILPGNPGVLYLLSAQVPGFVPSELPGGPTYYVLSKYQVVS